MGNTLGNFAGSGLPVSNDISRAAEISALRSSGVNMSIKKSIKGGGGLTRTRLNSIVESFD